MVGRVAEVYDTSKYTSPLVLGHPQDDCPAWGRADEMLVEGNTLYALVDVADPIVQAVKDGHYSGVSVAMFHPDNPSNPCPGEYYVRHIGLLGAAPAAIPDLNNALDTLKYAAPGEGILCYNAITWEEKGLFRFLRDFARGIREYLIDEKGQETADRVVPSWEIDMASDDLARLENPPSEPDNHYTADMMTDDDDDDTNTLPAAAALAAREKEIDDREAALAAKDQEYAASEAKQRREAYAAQVDRHIEAGRALPAQRDTLVELFVAADGADDVTIEYSATDKKSLPDALDAMLSAGPVLVPQGERSEGAGEQPPSGDVPTADDLTKYCAERAAEGEIVTPAVAMHRLTKAAK